MGLEVRGITKKFGEKTAVDHLSFEMKEPGYSDFWEQTEQGKPRLSAIFWGLCSRMREKRCGTALLFQEKPCPLDIFRRREEFI